VISAIDLPTIEVGQGFDNVVQWMTDNLEFFFDFVKNFLGWLIEDVVAGALHSVDPILLAVILAGIGVLARGWIFAVGTLIGFLLILTMPTTDLWEETIDTLALVLVSSLVAVVIAIPIGVLAARSRIVSPIVRPILDFMQTLPAFVYLIPAIFLFGTGVVPGSVATLIFAMPPGVRLAELGIRQVDSEMVEAGHAFGASPMSILTRIQLPLAMPTIMAGVNQVIMLSLSMVVIAGMVGAGGLGSLVYAGITRVDLVKGFEAGLAVVILAIYLDRLTSGLAARTSPHGGS